MQNENEVETIRRSSKTYQVTGAKLVRAIFVQGFGVLTPASNIWWRFGLVVTSLGTSMKKLLYVEPG